MSTTSSPEFDSALDAWLARCQKVVADHYTSNYPILSIPTLSIERGSKFARIVTDNGTQRSSWAFIALCDSETKGLGVVKQGDIHRCASWKIPSKHSRGNISDDSMGMASISSYGPAYLR